MGITSITTTSRSSYLRNTESFQRLSQTAEAAEGGVFFRMEKAVKKTKNDGAWVGYRSASIFSSTTNAAITTVYKQLGMEGSTNAYSSTGATPFVHALLSVKYILSDSQDGETPLMSWVATDGSVSLYRNEYTLPLGFMVPAGAAAWNHQDTNPIQVQNNFVACTTATGAIFTMVDSGSGSSYTFRVPQDGYYYGVLNDFSVKNITASFGERSTTYSNVDRDFILDLGYLHSGEEVVLSGNDDKTVNVSFYRLLPDAFMDAVSQLNEQPLSVDSYTDTLVQGHITAAGDGILFTSIPYEEGWTVYVDDVPVETSAFADAFLSVPLTAGEHQVRMEYMPVGLEQGTVISLASLLILLLAVAVTLFRRRLANRPSLDEQRRQRFPKPKKEEAPKEGAKAPEDIKKEEAEADSEADGSSSADKDSLPALPDSGRQEAPEDADTQPEEERETAEAEPEEAEAGSEAVRSEAAKPVTATPGAAEPETAAPEDAEPVAVKSETAETGAAEPETAAPEDAEPAAAEPETAETAARQKKDRPLAFNQTMKNLGGYVK